MVWHMTPVSAGDSSMGNDAVRRIPAIRVQLLADLERWETELT